VAAFAAADLAVAALVAALSATSFSTIAPSPTAFSAATLPDAAAIRLAAAFFAAAFFAAVAFVEDQGTNVADRGVADTITLLGVESLAASASCLAADFATFPKPSCCARINPAAVFEFCSGAATNDPNEVSSLLLWAVGVATTGA
jgi:hypothetical protein